MATAPPLPYEMQLCKKFDGLYIPNLIIEFCYYQIPNHFLYLYYILI